LPLSWIGQERAEIAARFGLGMMQPDYNLFVLGEVSVTSSRRDLHPVKSRLFIYTLNEQIRFFCTPLLQSLNGCLVLQSPLRDMVCCQ